MCLRRLGLVVPSAEAPDRVRVVPPPVAAAHHIAPLERAISRMRTELSAVTETFELIEQALSELFDRLIVFDRKLAYVAGPAGGEHELVEIRQPALVHYLSRAFELAWHRATPVPATSGYRTSATVTSDLQHSIMRMLVSGLTDEKIARELGMGRRTVAEHVRRLSERFGSSGRAQLGYAIARSGLLDTDGEQEP